MPNHHLNLLFFEETIKNNEINIPVKQSILEAIVHLFAKNREIRPLLVAPALPVELKVILIYLPIQTLKMVTKYIVVFV